MQMTLQQSKRAAAAERKTSPYVDKRNFAARWKGSIGWVDCMLARGLPHLKISSRRVRIDIEEADAWIKERYAQRKADRPPQRELRRLA